MLEVRLQGLRSANAEIFGGWGWVGVGGVEGGGGGVRSTAAAEAVT